MGELDTERVGGRHHELLIGQFALKVVAGPDAGLEFVSRRERTVIGTHELCDLLLKDRTVSRFHCEIALGEGRVIVRDLGSSNGTLVNGLSVIEAHLPASATLILGHSELRFELRPDKVVSVPLAPEERFELLVGRSMAMRAVFARLEKAASSEATVLILGETGTGKELAAESVHRKSTRKDGPFVVVDCGAIAPDLLESELFGHEKGAFTGADRARRGAFEEASGGTVFLDEIGELGMALQPKILGVLERREVKRLGRNDAVPVDIRVIAATHRDLRAEVNAGHFRSDLYYRLAVLEIALPPLRERTEDVPILVERLLADLQVPEAEAARLRSPEFQAELFRQRWPGNVRELRNYLERCVVLATDAPPEAAGEPEHLVDSTLPLKVARERWTRACERRYLEEALQRHRGSVAAAARAAGVDRMHLYRLLWRHGLRRRGPG